MTSVARPGTVLRWLERTFLVAGIGLAAWCAAVLIDAEHVRQLPVPSVQRVQASARLPGDHDLGSAAPDAGGWVARLEVPSISLSATVLEGTDDRTLRRAAGHIASTALPGRAGNVGIAGHRDTIFRPLRKIQIGQRMILTTASDILEYQVARVAIVNPEDVYVLEATAQPMLTLVTCYPFTFLGSAPQRLIVQADLTATRARP